MTWWGWLLAVFGLWPLLLLALVGNLGAIATLRYTAVQLLMWWATVLGWFVLIYPCARQRWVVDADSIADALEPRPGKISRWSARWLNPVWGNPQEGVNGQEAIVRDAAGNQVPYKPGCGPRLRAYFWSALRNSCDALKYLFAWEAGPLVPLTILGRTVRFGWLPMPQIRGAPRVPVLG